MTPLTVFWVARLSGRWKNRGQFFKCHFYKISFDQELPSKYDESSTDSKTNKRLSFKSIWWFSIVEWMSVSFFRLDYVVNVKPTWQNYKALRWLAQIKKIPLTLCQPHNGAWKKSESVPHWETLATSSSGGRLKRLEVCDGPAFLLQRHIRNARKGHQANL